MPKKELYIYTPLYNFVAEKVNKELSEVKESDDLIVRLNGPGGTTSAGFAILNKLSERKAKKTAIIDGSAMSMMAFMLPFFNTVKAHQASELMFHKAAYEDWYKPSAEEMRVLKFQNEQFEAFMRKKVEGKKGSDDFLNKLFESDVRNDVQLTAYEAMELGIIDEVNELSPAAYSEKEGIALITEKEAVKVETNSTNNNDSQMDLGKLKAEHPALYDEIFGLGQKAGAKAEKERAEAWAVYMEIDPAKVKEGIESGTSLSPKAMAEFSLQASKKTAMQEIKDENSETTDTPEVKDEEAIKAEASKKAMDEFFNEEGK